MFIDEGSVRMLGVPHTPVLRVGVLGWCDAEGTEALSWTGPSPLFDVQLLQAAAAFGNSAGQECICRGACNNQGAL